MISIHIRTHSKHALSMHTSLMRPFSIHTLTHPINTQHPNTLFFNTQLGRIKIRPFAPLERAANLKRAGFLDHQLWVTPFCAAEKYPGIRLRTYPSHIPLQHTVNTPYQSTLSTHSNNTSYQPTLSTHTIDLPLSTHPINPCYQPQEATFPIKTLVWMAFLSGLGR